MYRIQFNRLDANGLFPTLSSSSYSPFLRSFYPLLSFSFPRLLWLECERRLRAFCACKACNCRYTRSTFCMCAGRTLVRHVDVLDHGLLMTLWSLTNKYNKMIKYLYLVFQLTLLAERITRTDARTSIHTVMCKHTYHLVPRLPIQEDGMACAAACSLTIMKCSVCVVPLYSWPAFYR